MPPILEHVRRELAVRLDLVRALGVRGTARRVRTDRALPRLRRCREHVYAELWGAAADEAGAEIHALGNGFLELRRDGRSVRVQNDRTPLDDYVTVLLSEDKPLVHRLLADAAVPTPRHVEVGARDLAAACAFLRAAGTCVVKPAAQTDAGTGVTTGVRTPAQLERALLRAARSGPRVLVEQQAAGDMLRLLLLDGQLLHALRRRPPSVVGDGRSTVHDLVHAENERRLAGQGADALWLVTIDLDCLFALERQGIRLGSVPAAGERVFVKGATSQSRRDDDEPAADALPAELVADAARAARAVGLRLAGVDVVAGDDAWVVLEVNCTPALHPHPGVAVPILHALLAQ
ncbi:MAG: hypothetical protein JOY72_12515 [Actinobacteria bacterium]|nr:hypothetical protein [Actinomycetota bacterium]